MMKCTDVQTQLDDYLDGSLSADEQKAIDAHIAHCDVCRQELQAVKALREALHSLPVEEASPDFEEKVFATVRSHYGTGKKPATGRFVAGFATAMAASLALWFASTVYMPGLETGDSPVISLAVNQAQTVKLVFEAPTELADVTLSVQLPENIELEGYSGRRQLAWQTTLSKGQNVLALPVIAIGSGEGELVAQLKYGDKTRRFHLVVKTAGNGALIYQIQQLKSA